MSWSVLQSGLNRHCFYLCGNYLPGFTAEENEVFEETTDGDESATFIVKPSW